MPARPRQIALAFAVGTPYLESVTHGILDHARRAKNWQFAFSPDAAGVSMRSLKTWRGDGALAWIQHPEEARIARRLPFPVVNLSAQLTPQETRLPTVTADHEAAGRLAAAHFLSRRYEHFAFYGLEETDYSRLRLEGFRRELEKAGRGVSVCLARNTIHSAEPWRWDRRQVERWLLSLPRPVAVLAAHDYRARVILHSCQRLNLAVPREIAVAGVNNDAVTCEFCDPSLTSVELDGVATGRSAAALLEKLMRGARAPNQAMRMPPLRLVERESTRSIGIGDRRVLKAAEYLEQNLAAPIGIDQAARHAGVSRRLLEMRFREHLGCSPHAWLTRCRVEQARKLLADPARIKLNEIARRSGFADSRRLKSVFLRFTGQSPRQFRTPVSQSRTPD